MPMKNKKKAPPQEIDFEKKKVFPARRSDKINNPQISSSMRLRNAELSESLKKFPLYSQDGKKADAVVVAKYFFPATALTWYVTEGRQEDDDYLFFGLVVGTDTSAEMGYFSLSQLSELNLCGLKVERDMFFKPKKLSEICNRSVKEYINHYFKD